jgi:hypothetical protein
MNHSIKVTSLDTHLSNGRPIPTCSDLGPGCGARGDESVNYLSLGAFPPPPPPPETMVARLGAALLSLPIAATVTALARVKHSHALKQPSLLSLSSLSISLLPLPPSQALEQTREFQLVSLCVESLGGLLLLLPLVATVPNVIVLAVFVFREDCPEILLEQEGGGGGERREEAEESPPDRSARTLPWCQRCRDDS